MSTGATEIIVAAASEIGLVRSGNEDGSWIPTGFLRTGRRAEKLPGAGEGVFLAVADGVGGGPAGEVASKTVLEWMAAELESLSELFASSDPNGGEIRTEISNRAREVNERLKRYSAQNHQLTGMATTLTGVVVRTSDVIWLNAGDSRLYAANSSGARQVSRDHTLREISGDPSIPGNIIVNCFGGSNDFYLDTGVFPISGNPVLLLCSDGLTDYAGDEVVQSILKTCASGKQTVGLLEESVSSLVDAALSGGGGDNVTAMLISVGTSSSGS